MKMTLFPQGLMILPALGCLSLMPIAAQAQTLTVQDGLQLWLKADAGVAADGEGTVSDWTDQTVNANIASQFDPTKAPKLVANAVNGKPVLRFDGVDDYLEMPDADSISFTGDLTTFFVLKFTDFSTYRAVWAKTSSNLPGPVDYYTLPNTGVPRVFRGNGQMGAGNNDFSDASSPLRANAFITAGFEIEDTQVTHYLAAQPIGGRSFTTNIGDADTPLIIGSRGDLFTKMKGDIAEIVIYNRALTEAERAAVTGYLGQKYNIQNILPTIGLTAMPPGPDLDLGTTVTLTATPADADGTVSKVEFYSNGGLLATATGAPWSVKITLDSTGTYNFTAKVTDDKGGSATSTATVRNVTGGTGANLDVLANLSLWVKADAGVTTGAGDVVTGWADQSPNHNDASPADEFTAPTLVSNAGPNGKPVLRFDGADDTLIVPDSDSLSFDGDMTSFFVVKMDDFASYRAVWAKTTQNFPASVDFYLLPGSGVPRFFRGAGTGNNLRSIDGSAWQAGSFMLGGFGSQGDVMSQYLNGQLNGSSAGAVGKVDLDTELTIGTRQDRVTLLKGDLAEIVIYKSALSAADRRKVEVYLATKYSVPLTTTLNTAPTAAVTAPAAGATFTVPADVTLTATAADTDGSITKVEFLVNGTVAATDTTAPYETTVSFPIAGTAQISVRATDNLGAVTTSEPVTITLNSVAVSDLPALANLKLWLKADTGVTATGDAVSAWNDQSGNLNHAVQASTSQQPTLVANGLNGKPVLHFDGVDDVLSAGNSPSLAITGDISSFFVVRFDDFDTYRTVWAKTDSNVPRATDFYTLQNTGMPQVFRGGFNLNQNVLGQLPLTAGEFAVVGFDMKGSDVYLFQNGWLSGFGNITIPLEDTGKPVLIGQRDDGVTRLKGDVAEIVIYNSSLSDTDRAKVISYLGTKYTIPVQNVSTAMPPLSISSNSGNVTVTWPVETTGFLLESSDTMETGTWQEVLDAVGNSATQPLGPRNFFRLRRAPLTAP